MKKRVVAFFLLVVSTIILCGCEPFVANKPFELRCGIHFGDTIADVKIKETLSFKSESENELTTKKGELAGVNVESLTYRFDENGKLYSVLWTVLSSKNNIFPSQNYDILYEQLTKKYGKPNSTDIQSSFLIEGAAIEEMFGLMKTDMSFALNMVMGKAGPLKQSEWQVKSSGNENVKIDLLLYQVKEEDYRLRLSYDIYTDEQLQHLQSQKQQQTAEMMNDI